MRIHSPEGRGGRFRVEQGGTGVFLAASVRFVGGLEPFARLRQSEPTALPGWQPANYAKVAISSASGREIWISVDWDASELQKHVAHRQNNTYEYSQMYAIQHVK